MLSGFVSSITQIGPFIVAISFMKQWADIVSTVLIPMSDFILAYTGIAACFDVLRIPKCLVLK